MTKPITGGEAGIMRGSPAYLRICISIFFAGFCTFSLIYCVQPLLPSFADHYHITPTQSSLALSMSTGFLAFSIMLSSVFSEAYGRRGLMSMSMSVAALCNIAAAFAPDWHWLLIARSLEGFLLGGVPAVAMAYLAEEITPSGLGRIMGLYVAGSSFGGMMGRVGMGVLIEWFDWQTALAVIGAICFVAAIIFFFLLPKSKNFVVHRAFDARYHARAWFGHISSVRLVFIYCYIFLIFGVFVAILNYTSFHLIEPPFSLSPTSVGFIFVCFIAGMVVSPIAGGLTEKYARSTLLFAAAIILIVGILLSLAPWLPLFILGFIFVTIGFFTAHSVASGWVGRIAVGAKGHASALYLLFYYMGSSFIGSYCGWFWQHGGWHSVAYFTISLLLLSLVFCFLLRRRELQDIRK